MGELFRFAMMAKDHGVLPVAGGLLDQTRYTVNSFELIWNDVDQFKVEGGIID